MQCPQRPFGFKYAKKYILTKLKYISEHILNLFGAFRIQFKHLIEDEVSNSPAII